MLEESNPSNLYRTKSKPSKLSFSNLSKPFPLDSTISNETMMVAATMKEDEEVTEATFAIVIETMAMTIEVVFFFKQKTAYEIPTISISPANYMEGDIVQTSVLYSKDEL